MLYRLILTFNRGSILKTPFKSSSNFSRQLNKQKKNLRPCFDCSKATLFQTKTLSELFNKIKQTTSFFFFFFLKTIFLLCHYCLIKYLSSNQKSLPAREKSESFTVSAFENYLSSIASLRSLGRFEQFLSPPFPPTRSTRSELPAIKSEFLLRGNTFYQAMATWSFLSVTAWITVRCAEW